MEQEEKKLSEKSQVLLKAINAMSDLSDFEDKLKDLTGIGVYDITPSLTAGILFDLLTESLLTESGDEILSAFLFDPIEKHSEDNPFIIYDVIDGINVEYKIGTPKELCIYLENKNLFK